MQRLALFTSLLVASAACAACEQGGTKTPPPAPSGAPGAQAATQPGAAASQPAEMIPLAPGQGVAHGEPFSGLVRLGEGVTEADVKDTDILFIMARKSQGAGRAGSLVAVQRIVGPKFPLRYEMNAKNLMMPAMPFSGPFIVHARLDRDGDPMTKTKDDLYGAHLKEVGNGDEGVHLVLKKKEGEIVLENMPGLSAPGAAASQPAGAASQPAGTPPMAPPKGPASGPAK